ncbi:hypothetical protein FHS72_003402 [Loktanella ponticola]|uniref:Uncharacterized protein n=1 Tax=Yoonia ponticola TaxID=1524255 RepID=A0A7W9EZF5_9RHOB|nr:hypothetical protein [Yoonia ponticola]
MILPGLVSVAIYPFLNSVDQDWGQNKCAGSFE